jgi:hypothetical protein
VKSAFNNFAGTIRAIKLAFIDCEGMIRAMEPALNPLITQSRL